MLNKKVIASAITNLTDARYFAARGVNYLLFDLDHLQLAQIEEIKEWVEGPKMLLLFSMKNLGLLDEAILRLKPYAIGAKTGQALNEMAFLQGHVSFFDWNTDEVHLDGETFRNIDQSVELEELSPNEGIIISGGSEEEIGVKNYDELDIILDLLEI